MLDGAAGIISTGVDTFPKLLVERAKERPHDTAMRHRRGHIWYSWGWHRAMLDVKTIAHGLAALGFKHGDRLAVIGDNRPHLYWSMLAAQVLGGVAVPINPAMGDQPLADLLNHLSIRHLFVEGQQQLTQLTTIRAQTTVEHVIYDDPAGVVGDVEASVYSLDALYAKGRDHYDQTPDMFEAETQKGRGSDVAVILATDLETPTEKPVSLTYDNLLTVGKKAAEVCDLTLKQAAMAVMPMGSITDYVVSCVQHLAIGFRLDMAASAGRIFADMHDAEPRYLCGSKDFFVQLAQQPLAQGRTNRAWRRRLGLNRLDCALAFVNEQVTDVVDSYRNMGVDLRPVFGAVEAGSFVTMQEKDDVQAETLGKPLPGVELKADKSDQLLVKTPGLFKEYVGQEAATEQVKDRAWFKTGLKATITDDGALKL